MTDPMIDFLSAFNEWLTGYLAGTSGAAVTQAAAVEVATAPAEQTTGPEGLSLKDLRAELIEAGYTAASLKGANRETLEATWWEEPTLGGGTAPGDEAEADEEEAEADEDEAEEAEAEAEDEGPTREDYESATLTAVRAAAKAMGYGPAGRTLDKDGILDLMFPEEGDEEEAEAEDEEEQEGYSREELEEMSLTEVRQLAKAYGITVPRGTKQAAIVESIMNYGAEEE